MNRLLGASALAGTSVLKFFGISLPAFQAGGGLIIILMGLEMLYGRPTRIHGDRQAPVQPEDQILVPFATPLIAGPGAITTVVTFTTRTGIPHPELTGVAAVAALSLFLFVVLLAATWFDRILRDHAHVLITRFLGLILVAAGFQFGLSGIRNFLSG
ncbi:MAG: MarC family protein [Gemmatimonadota bacterium]